jgi:Fic family protein
MDKGYISPHINQMEMDGKMVSVPDITTLSITPAILSLIAELDEFKGAWRAFGRIAPDRLSGLRRVARIESIGTSTRIEGAKLSNLDVEKLLSNLQLGSFATRDEQEVAGYAEVMETVFAHWADIPLTENHIKQLHRDLLIHSHKDERHRGDYKTLANHVEAFDADGNSLGVVFATATPFETPSRITELTAVFADKNTARICIRCWLSRYSLWSSWKSTRSRTAMAGCPAC